MVGTEEGEEEVNGKVERKGKEREGIEEEEGQEMREEEMKRLKGEE